MDDLGDPTAHTAATTTQLDDLGDLVTDSVATTTQLDDPSDPTPNTATTTIQQPFTRAMRTADVGRAIGGATRPLTGLAFS